MEQKDNVKKPGVAVSVTLIAIGLMLIVGSIVWWVHDEKTDKKSDVNSFQSCKDAGGSIAESYPEQCFIDGKSFTNSDQTLTEPQAYVGLTEDEAIDKAKQQGRAARVVERDSEPLPVTMDLQDGRLNLTVVDGKVIYVDEERLEADPAETQ